MNSGFVSKKDAATIPINSFCLYQLLVIEAAFPLHLENKGEKTRFRASRDLALRRAFMEVSGTVKPNSFLA